MLADFQIKMISEGLGPFTSSPQTVTLYVNVNCCCCKSSINVRPLEHAVVRASN
jgi:hypothetical protein